MAGILVYLFNTTHELPAMLHDKREFSPDKY